MAFASSFIIKTGSYFLKRWTSTVSPPLSSTSSTILTAHCISTTRSFFLLVSTLGFNSDSTSSSQTQNGQSKSYSDWNCLTSAVSCSVRATLTPCTKWEHNLSSPFTAAIIFSLSRVPFAFKCCITLINQPYTFSSNRWSLIAPGDPKIAYPYYPATPQLVPSSPPFFFFLLFNSPVNWNRLIDECLELYCRNILVLYQCDVKQWYNKTLLLSPPSSGQETLFSPQTIFPEYKITTDSYFCLFL